MHIMLAIYTNKLISNIAVSRHRFTDDISGNVNRAVRDD